MTTRIHPVSIFALAFLFGLMFSCTATEQHATPTFAPTITLTNTPIPTVTDMPTPTATSTPTIRPSIGTPTPSNDQVIALLAQTPQPTLMSVAPPNETGIIPGLTTEDQVIALAGQPWSKNRANWSYNSSKMPDLQSVLFSRGIVREINVETLNMTAETVVLQYGPPDLVAYYFIKDSPSNIPVTAAPLGPPFGYLVYLSKGIEFSFSCRHFLYENGVRSCPGLEREANVDYKKYHIPMTITDWLSQQPNSSDNLYIRPWTGFSD